MRHFDSGRATLVDIAAAISPPAGALDPSAEQAVREMVAAVRARGDDAVIEYSRKWDWPDADAARLRVPSEDIRAAGDALPEADAAALRAAINHVRDYHERHVPGDHMDPAEYGAVLGWRYTPIESVAVYAPRGIAPLPSSLIMGAVPAQVADVPRVAVASPPMREGEVNAGILAAAALLGITEIYRVGGPWAIAALAYGTQTIEPVDKIVGPGNLHVNLAKAAVAGTVGVDGFYGPSEVVILADEQANSRLIAADLVAQAEHSPEALPVLVTPSRRLVEQIEARLQEALAHLAAPETAGQCLQQRGAAVQVRDLSQGIELVNLLAPEHLELLVESPHDALATIRNAGCILMGPSSPTAVSDYLAGPSHILPTGRSARFSSGIGVLDFMKRTSVVSVTPEWLRHNGAHVERLAQMEGLQGHARSVRLRTEADEH